MLLHGHSFLCIWRLLQIHKEKEYRSSWVDDWEKTVKQIAADSEGEEKKHQQWRREKENTSLSLPQPKSRKGEPFDLEEWGVLGVEILVLKTPPPLFFIKSESILPLSFPPQKYSYLKHQVWPNGCLDEGHM